MNVKFMVRYIPESLGFFSNQEIFWSQQLGRFAYRSEGQTRYSTQEEAEGSILWIIGKLGAEYIGRLEVVAVPCQG